QLTAMTLVEIGKNFGNRDHSTVLYGIEKISTARKSEADLNKRIEELEGELRAGRQKSSAEEKLPASRDRSLWN
ncbi:MAG: helix-turn-helix domain-containing protein, partial [Candidatus Eisenbacteria bacterium]